MPVNAANKQVVEEQIAYYRARAHEYDDWFYRRGRYDRGEAENAAWLSEASLLQQIVRGLGHFADILELACGTGIWTQELAAIGDQVTAVDSSPEVLAINAAKVSRNSVRYVQADLFAWQTDGYFDLVFCSFWLSHVPPEQLDAFLGKVRKMGKRVFAIDSLREETSTARDHVLPEKGETLQTRKLNDGREFRVVKIYYDPAQLRHKLEEHGFNARVETTGRYFWYAIGE